MNLGGKLKTSYGVLSSDILRWISENETGYTNEEKERIYRSVIDNYPAAPSKAQLAEEFEKVKPLKVETNNYAWKLCKRCNTGYALNLMICPKCYKEGLACSEGGIVLSPLPPPPVVIKFNKTFYKSDTVEKTCYACEDNRLSYCSNFGNPDHCCPREEFDNCSCRQCCVSHKKWNSRQVKHTVDVTVKRLDLNG